MERVSIAFKIEKASKTGRFIAGWMSVTDKDGQPVTDSQDDRTKIETVTKAFHKYMDGARVIKNQHAGEPIGKMVEMVVIDDEVAKALGMTDTRRGVWGKAEITDVAVQKQVREGTFGGFSIGGRGKRTPITKAGVAKSGPLADDVHVQQMLKPGRQKGGAIKFQGRSMSKAERRRIALDLAAKPKVTKAITHCSDAIEKARGLITGGSLRTRRALLQRSIGANRAIVAGQSPGGLTRRLGRAQNYLTRRLYRGK